MKIKTKTFAALYILILSIGTILSLYIPKNEVTANDVQVIPNEAIRLRILANSDSSQDQEIKRQVRDAVNAEITKWVEELTSVEDARNLLRAKIPEIQKIAQEVLEQQGVQQSVQSQFGTVQFPTKLYGEFLYPAGEYEAILITLGEGKGANWWCVLFPPLCFLDFSNGVAVSEGFDEEEEQKEEKEKEDSKEENDSKEEKEDKEEKEEQPPVYVKEDEESVKVKFFLVEIFQKIFG
nr:stage II sporulation protein R [Bacillus dakarensis]